MNPMTTFMKKQGVKVALPLLLLATACGEGAPVAESDKEPELGNVAGLVEGQPDTSAFAMSSAGEVPGSADAEMNVDFDAGEAMSAGVSDDANAAATVATNVATKGSDTAAAVPEPTTLAGLAVAALGLGAIKRKNAA